MFRSRKKCAVDRHIPHRAGENFDTFHYDFAASIFEMDDIWPPESRSHLNYAQKFFRRKFYIERLWKIVSPKTRKILNFTLVNAAENEDTDDSNDIWPVIPRKRPLITHPMLILDLPDIDTNLCYDIIDWNRNDQIAAICDGGIYIWGENDTKIILISASPTESVKHCLKFSCDGKLLAVAHDQSKIIIFNTSYKEVVLKRRCCKRKPCVTSSFVWSRDGVLSSGCTNGNITSWLRHSRRTIHAAHKGAVIGMHYSCNEYYLASSGLDKTIRIRTWPELNLVFTINNSLPGKAFAWHPWQESLLVCCKGENNNEICVWNICKQKIVYWMDAAENVSVDAITFNKKSGELVVSLHYAPTGKTFIAVFPNFSTINDGIIWHLGRVPYLLWNSDSTKLLTAGSDEYICIWNFFGGNRAGKPPNRKTQSHVASVIDCFNYFKSCIR